MSALKIIKLYTVSPEFCIFFSCVQNNSILHPGSPGNGPFCRRKSYWKLALRCCSRGSPEEEASREHFPASSEPLPVTRNHGVSSRDTRTRGLIQRHKRKSRSRGTNCPEVKLETASPPSGANPPASEVAFPSLRLQWLPDKTMTAGLQHRTGSESCLTQLLLQQALRKLSTVDQTESGTLTS